MYFFLFRQYYINLAMVLLFIFPAEGHTAAWNLKEGESQVIINSSFYQTKEFFDQTNNRQKQPRFSKFETDILYEYGYDDAITFGFHPRLQRVSQDIAGGGELTDLGIASADIFARVNIFQQSNLFYDSDLIVFSLQPLLKLSPHDNDNNNVSTGNRKFSVSSEQWDIEMRALVGYSFKYSNYYHFINTEFGYRLREGEPSDEVFFDGTLGMSFYNNYMILGQIFYVSSIKEGSNKKVSLANPLDYQLTKLQFSVVKEFNKKYSLQLGLFKNIDGENTGVGNGGLVSLWINF